MTERRARCLIVDDEAPAREELRYLLRGYDHIQVVGEATNAEEALLLLQEMSYDVVLLDIRMPGDSGLEVARALAAMDRAPAVIFTTAYPDHAVEAFDVGAADYLVKPFDSERLQRALARALSAVDEDDPRPPHRDDPRPAARAESPITRLPVQHGDRTVLIEPGSIVYATAARGYSYLKLAEDRVLVSQSLAELEHKLPDGFLRTHRSYLVNLAHVRELVSDYQGGLVLVMDDRQHSKVEVSRRQAAALRRALGL